MFLVIPLVEFRRVLGVDINVHHENPATLLCHLYISSVNRGRHCCCLSSSASSVGDAAGSAGPGRYHQVPPRTPTLPRVRRRTRPPVRDPILSVQEASQRLTRVMLGLLGHSGIRRPVEAVTCPRLHM